MLLLKNISDLTNNSRLRKVSHCFKQRWTPGRRVSLSWLSVTWRITVWSIIEMKTDY